MYKLLMSALDATLPQTTSSCSMPLVYHSIVPYYMCCVSVHANINLCLVGKLPLHNMYKLLMSALGATSVCMN